MRSRHDPGEQDEALAAIKLVVPEDLYRAFQRCVWIQIHESGRTQLEIMDEVVRDFLRKYGC
ncbi:MAG: hypothetical protein HQQ73_08920 [Desulfobulbaceae bacterium]|nr:hypothetical protein [Desulfobulbaceae bacterium]